MDFHTMGVQAPQGDVEEGGHEGDQPVHVVHPVPGGPSLPERGGGAVAWDPSGHGEEGVGLAPEMVAVPVGGGGAWGAPPSLAQVGPGGAWGPAGVGHNPSSQARVVVGESYCAWGRRRVEDQRKVGNPLGICSWGFGASAVTSLADCD